ncbi:MAG: Peptidase, family [Actinotalea sp.]|nr:Peptidase, family [Actinotalea sp.]
MAWVLPAGGTIISGYGPRILEGAIGDFHFGVDVTAKRGPVFAANDGVVRSLFKTKKGAWVLDIRHGAEDGMGVRTRYIHMRRDEIRVEVDEEVTRGQWIGNSGDSGTKHAHLHFEVLVNDTLTNPVPFLALRGLTFNVSPVSQVIGGVAVAPTRATALTTLDPEDDMTPEQENLLKHAVAMATEARGLAAHAVVLLSNLPSAVAKATMWETTVARNVDGTDTNVPVIQEIADSKTSLLGLSPADLDLGKQEIPPLVLPEMSDADFTAISEVMASENSRRLNE